MDKTKEPSIGNQTAIAKQKATISMDTRTGSRN